MPARALRLVVVVKGGNEEAGPKTKNAREGIETQVLSSTLDPDKLLPKTKNAREGIETGVVSFLTESG